ncbi:hypothetical protein ZEAMMB73_Zm00001d025457 [Zea mays]|uniref:Uncharacterized protein n=1 Tax=Zea mays TaxID=4577 RepID=A0A1D6J780_MAIZE|nr:hypothetical protein ZEAMMB73_Zm00001d025457 [Zea mays]
MASSLAQRRHAVVCGRGHSNRVRTARGVAAGPRAARRMAMKGHPSPRYVQSAATTPTGHDTTARSRRPPPRTLPPRSTESLQSRRRWDCSLDPRSPGSPRSTASAPRSPWKTRTGLRPRSVLSMEASAPRSTTFGRWCPAPSSTPSSTRATAIPSSTSPSSATCPGPGTGSERITVHRRASARARAAARRCLSAVTATAKACSA